MDNTARTWAEIDLTAIRHNLTRVRTLIGPDPILMAVVKANAYGHGMIEVTRAALESGVGFLGVATLPEALALRKAGITTPVLVLGYVPLQYAQTVIENDISVTIFDTESALAYSRAAGNRKAKLHVKLDTGMGRIGFLPDEESIAAIESINRLTGIELEGIFTHFAVADKKDKTYTFRQLQLFEQTTTELKNRGVNPPIRHAANSAAIMEVPEANFDMVRSGIITYGLYPSDEVEHKNIDLIPAMRLKSRVTMVKTLKKGEAVSYGCTYISPHDMKVATVAAGYADGYNRSLSNRAWAAVRGQLVPLIGTVCMDQCMFDVSGVDGVKTDDEIILFGRPEDGITVDDLAGMVKTINYELVCLITERVPRVYI
jgi:alanine racemase